MDMNPKGAFLACAYVRIGIVQSVGVGGGGGVAGLWAWSR